MFYSALKQEGHEIPKIKGILRAFYRMEIYVPEETKYVGTYIKEFWDNTKWRLYPTKHYMSLKRHPKSPMLEYDDYSVEGIPQYVKPSGHLNIEGFVDAWGIGGIY